VTAWNRSDHEEARVTDMTDDEAYAFIGARPARTAKLATVGKDGGPQVAPIWVALDGRALMFTTHAGSLKGRALRRDPRVSMCFDDERPPFSFVVVTATVTISEDLDELLHWATVLGGRYMGDEVAEQYGRRNAVAGELLVRATPTRITGVRDVAA
jgi:PPOX class probable F420-dependent enzyme